jgi:hypothetical protein
MQSLSATEVDDDPRSARMPSRPPLYLAIADPEAVGKLIGGREPAVPQGQ